MDITYYGGSPYLSVIDCGSRYGVLRRLPSCTTAAILHVLQEIFYLFGPPTEMLSDNAKAFKSTQVEEFVQKWKIRWNYVSVENHRGNGIVERWHRTIKVMMRRCNYTAEQACFYYNIAVHSAIGCGPADALFQAKLRIPGIRGRQNVDAALPEHNHDDHDGPPQYVPGQAVFRKPLNSRCDTVWAESKVAEASARSVILDSSSKMSVRHVRPKP